MLEQEVLIERNLDLISLKEIRSLVSHIHSNLIYRVTFLAHSLLHRILVKDTNLMPQSALLGYIRDDQTKLYQSIQAMAKLVERCRSIYSYAYKL